jgi:hypothetical protein
LLGLAARDLSKVLLVRFLTYQKSNLPYTLNPRRTWIQERRSGDSSLSYQAELRWCCDCEMCCPPHQRIYIPPPFPPTPTPPRPPAGDLAVVWYRWLTISLDFTHTYSPQAVRIMQQESLSALKFQDKATVDKRADTKQTTGAQQAANSRFCSSAKTKTVKLNTRYTTRYIKGRFFSFFCFFCVCISKEKHPSPELLLFCYRKIQPDSATS